MTLETEHLRTGGRDDSGAHQGTPFGRDRQMAALRAALESARRGGTEVVCVTGRSGVGKSTLLDAFARESEMAAMATFGRVPTGAHSALSAALSQIAQNMLGRPDAAVEAWTRRLRAEIGAASRALTWLVPQTEFVFGEVGTVDGDDPSSVRARLVHAVTHLLAITAEVAGPVMVVLDDMHRAYGADIDLLASVLANQPEGVLVVGAWRASRPDGIDRLEAAVGIEIRRVEVPGLDRDQLESLLLDAHGLSVTDDVLTLIDQRTQGNPLFLQQLVRSARAADAVVYDLPTGAHRIDARWLQEQPVTEGMAEIFTGQLASLPDDHQLVLAAAATLDRVFSLTDAVFASDRQPEDVAAALWSGIESGFVVGLGNVDRATLDPTGQYRFAHDRVADAARSRLSPTEIAATHLRIGRRLRDLGEDRLFEAASHFAAGAPNITERAERAEACRLALAAGQRARREASLSLARRHFEVGVDLHEPQLHDADVLHDLRCGLVETAWLTRDPGLDDHLEAAWRECDGAIQRAELALLQIKIDLARYEERRALELGIATLAELGVPLPRNTSRRRLMLALGRTAMSLRGKTDDDLAGLPVATDGVAAAAAPIISELISTSYAVDPDLFPFVILRSIDLTLDHGRMPVSPVAFAGYGLLLVVLGRHDAALRFGDLALRMADEPECADYRPWAHFLHYNFIHHWRRPARDALPAVQAAHEEALQCGDVEYAGYLAASELATRFSVGTPLDEYDRRASELIETFPSQKKQVEICEAVRQLAHNLLGRNDDPLLLGGTTTYDEREILPRAIEQRDRVSLSVYAAIALGIRFWIGEYELAVEVAEEYEEALVGVQGAGALPTLTAALSCLRHDPTSSASKRWIGRGDKLFTKWAKGSPENFLASSLLLKGEIALSRGNYPEAEARFSASIEAARRYRQHITAALAREGAARMYIESGREVAARGFVVEAAELWQQLGYRLRLDHLRTLHPWLEGEIAATPEPQRVDDAFDLNALVERLLTDVIATTAGTRCKLVLRRHEALELAATATVDGTVIHRESEAIEDGGEYAANLLRYSVRSREPVVVRADSTYSDPYVASGRARSLMVVPIVDRGRSVAALHVEHADLEDAFSPSVVERVEQLAQQGAVALEHAILEQELRAARHEREVLQAAQARLVPSEFLQELGAADAEILRAGETVEREWSSLFSDLWGFATLSEEMSVDELAELVTGFLRAVEPAIVAHQGFVHDTRGDEVLALFRGGPMDAVRAALGMRRAQHAHNRERQKRGDAPLRWGIGINHGPVYLGMVEGVNRAKAGVLGDSLNLASRIEALTRRYDLDLLVSDRVASLLDDDVRIRRVEKVRVVSKREPVTVFEIYDADADDLVAAKDAVADVLAEAFASYDDGEFEHAIRAFERVADLLPEDRVAPIHLDSARRLLAEGAPDDWDGTHVLTSK